MGQPASAVSRLIALATLVTSLVALTPTIARAVPAATAPPSATSIESLEPARLLDTRPGQDTVDGQFAGGGRRGAESTLPLDVVGRGGVPADAAAVVVNIAAADAGGPGYVTAFPCNRPRPTASNLNFGGGETIANLVVARTDPDGRICLYTHAATDLVVDVTGYVPTNSSYLTTLSPARLLETRIDVSPTVDHKFEGLGRLAADDTVKLNVVDRGGVPADAAAVMVNVTAVDPSAPGAVRAYPCDQEAPNASNLNHAAGQSIPVLVLAKTDPNGNICLHSIASTDLIVDVTGYVPTSSGLGTLNPARLIDTRPGQQTTDGRFEGDGRLAAGTTTTLDVTGRGQVPAGASAVVVNVAAVDAAAPGFITAYPCNETRPNASSLNHTAGQTIPNLTLAKTDPDGNICIYNSAATDLIVDVAGFEPAESTPKAPERPGGNCEYGNSPLDPGDCVALTALYGSTNGEGWKQADGWLTDTNPCGWFGITCNAEGTRVTKVELDNENGLAGPIPPEIGFLDAVTLLALDNNDVSGEIPARIGDMRALRVLRLDDNPLTGSVPPEIGNLTNLTELYLGYANFTGGIPAEIGNLTNLERLAVGYGRLSGNIAPELGRLTNLTFLGLEQNRFSGELPPELGTLDQLERLYVYANELTGPILPSLGDLDNLEHFNAYDNNFSGSIPAELGNLSNLTNLSLADNDLVGTIPTELGKLSRLEDLQLFNNRLAGSIPAELGNLSNLATLWLQSNRLSGDVTDAVLPLTETGNLENLNLADNDCLTTTSGTLADRLDALDPAWSNGC